LLTCVVGEKVINCFDGTYDKSRLKEWSDKNILKCPDCGGLYEYCHGEIVFPYFRHKEKNEDCDGQYSEPETEEHRNGKLLLYNWLQKLQNESVIENVKLEAYISETKQRPDLYFEMNGKRFVIEFQCTPIASEFLKRHELYDLGGISDIWILGHDNYKNTSRKIENLVNSRLFVKLNKIIFNKNFVFCDDLNKEHLFELIKIVDIMKEKIKEDNKQTKIKADTKKFQLEIIKEVSEKLIVDVEYKNKSTYYDWAISFYPQIFYIKNDAIDFVFLGSQICSEKINTYNKDDVINFVLEKYNKTEMERKKIKINEVFDRIEYNNKIRLRAIEREYDRCKYEKFKNHAHNIKIFLLDGYCNKKFDWGSSKTFYSYVASCMYKNLLSGDIPQFEKHIIDFIRYKNGDYICGAYDNMKIINNSLYIMLKYAIKGQSISNYKRENVLQDLKDYGFKNVEFYKEETN
jgi:hypothetical protein